MKIATKKQEHKLVIRGSGKRKSYGYPGVLVLETSGNRNTGLMSVTYASIWASCGVCPFKDNGCYALFHWVGKIVKRLNLEAKRIGATPEMIARFEALGIDLLTGLRLLRVHVAGDCRTKLAAAILGAAMVRHALKEKQNALSEN